MAAQGDDCHRGCLPRWDAAAGVWRQLLGQAGAAADGVGEGDVTAARHPLALALKGAYKPALLVAAEAVWGARGALAVAQLQLHLAAAAAI